MDKKGEFWTAVGITLFLLLCIAGMIFFSKNPIGAQEAQEQPKLEKIVIHNSSDAIWQWIEIKYTNSIGNWVQMNIYIGSDVETATWTIGEPDLIWEINNRKYLGYKDVGIVLVLNQKENRYIQEIRIVNPLAETDRGLKIGDSFARAVELYGKPQEDYNPYNDPKRPDLNNNRLMVYKRIGILFYGVITPDTITSFAIFEGH